MNVSPLNSNAVSFGSIKRSAAEKAIQAANGDVSKLNSIREAIESQKNNSYDIKGLPSHEYYNYIVIKSGEHSGYCYMTLDEACEAANHAEERDKWVDKEAETKKLQKPEFDRLANELLESCEE